MTELHPLLPPCVRSAGPFSELYLAEALPTLPSWRPGEELVKEHQTLRQLFMTAGEAVELLPNVVARALEHLGHRPEPPPPGPTGPSSSKERTRRPWPWPWSPGAATP